METPKQRQNGPFLTDADEIILANLLQQSQSNAATAASDPPDASDLLSRDLLLQLNDYSSKTFRQPIITGSDTPEVYLPSSVNRFILQPYVAWARSILRRRDDVVFITHMMIHVATAVPSAIYLYYRFSWLHAFLHWLLIAYYCGPFSILHHNHIHQNGFMIKKYWLFDHGYLYIVGPLMGHTWNSFYYHHVKHHHIEDNGPDDLSSTLRFQRDDLVNFLQYFGRFFLLIWIDLPLYFLRKNRPAYAFKYASWEILCMANTLLLSYLNLKASIFVLLIPLLQMRLGLMAGNWGQHAFVDKGDPTSDFRSSITLIDEASNRHCFNDGYHTAHHLNSVRHWRDLPMSFFRDKHRYAVEGALVFQNVGYLEITFYLLRKNYDHLAKCLIPMGDQAQLSHEDIKTLLRSRTEKFSEVEIERCYPKHYKKT